MYTHHRWQNMADIEIRRGYEVLPDNNVRFGIRITNTSDLAISDVEVILDYSESMFKVVVTYGTQFDYKFDSIYH